MDIQRALSELERHGIHPLSELKAVEKGLRNQVYDVDTERGRSILKLYDSPVRAENECSALRLLHENGIPVPRLIYPGEPSVPPSFILLEHLDYPLLGEIKCSDPSYRKGVEHAARLLAKIHKIKGFTAGPLAGDGREGTLFEQALPDPALLERAKSIEYYGALMRLFRDLEGRDAVREKLNGRDSFDLVHGDYHDGQLLADPATGEIVALIDLESSRFGDRHSDCPQSFRFKKIPQETKGEWRKLFLELYSEEYGEGIDPEIARFYEESKLLELGIRSHVEKKEWMKPYEGKLRMLLEKYGFL